MGDVKKMNWLMVYESILENFYHPLMILCNYHCRENDLVAKLFFVEDKDLALEAVERNGIHHQENADHGPRVEVDILHPY